MQFNNFNSQVSLSVIFPVRITENNESSILKNITNIKFDSSIPDDIEFLLVDDSIEKIHQEKLQLLCKEMNIKYIYLEHENLEFSLARIRNYGAKIASSKYIMFQDIDMFPYKGFYQEIVNEIKIQDLENNPNRFIMISCIYLTHFASKTYNPINKNFYLDKLLIMDKTYIEKFSSGTSLILLNREYFLQMGGYDEQFCKWGHEDIDLNCRLILNDNLYKLPNNFLTDEKNFNNIYQYEGWKSIYRLYGDRTFYKGIVLFHNWHEINIKNSYYSNKTANKNLFHSKLKNYLHNYSLKKEYQLLDSSILLDRYKFSLSPENRLKCKSFLFFILNKIKSFL